jgi:hypothetical protein
MNQLTGAIKNIAAQRGFRPSLDIQLEIVNPDDIQLDFTWMLARVAVSFSRNTKTGPSRGNALELGIAVPRNTLPQFRKTTTTNFVLPLDDLLVKDLETARGGINVIVYMSVAFNAIANGPQGVSVSQQLVSGAVADPNYGGQDTVRIVPSSEWEEIIDGLHIPDMDSQRKLEEYAIQGEQKLKELDSTLKSAKEAAELIGIVEHAKFFEEEALDHKRSAGWWLAVTVLLAAIASFAAGWNFYKAESLIKDALAKSDVHKAASADTKPDGLVGLEVQLTVAKVIILSILLSAAIWTGRVYKAHRHNFIINRHRRNALSTFQTFATGTADPQTKNAVLLQATTCIFGPQNTGYISQEKEAEGYPQILEIFRGVGSSGKKD